MAQPRKGSKRNIEHYTHADKERLNNPPVGLVTPDTDQDAGRKIYAYDPHLDPQLVWAGKAEHTSFEVPTVSLHVHERIDPRTIMEAVRRRNGTDPQFSLFADPKENPPIRQAIEFYKHRHNWSNRLIAGDSLLVMNSLLEKEGMAGQVQMIYMDPPYGIKYGSNFQPFVSNRDVKDGKDEDLTTEPETLKAFRDTWELGIHSYLAYMCDRLLLARELLHESGSCFVQISDENLHLVRCLLDEVFGTNNFVSQVSFQKTGGIESKLISSTVDYIIWYAKDKNKTKFHRLYRMREVGDKSLDRYDMLAREGGETRRLTTKEISTGEIPEDGRRYQLAPLYSDGASGEPQEFVFEGVRFFPRKDTHWKTTVPGLERLAQAGRIEIMGSVIRYRRFVDDFPVVPIGDRWESMQIGIQRTYVVQTAQSVIQRCLLMTTDPGDLIFDPTCGSGTTAYVVTTNFSGH